MEAEPRRTGARPPDVRLTDRAARRVRSYLGDRPSVDDLRISGDEERGYEFRLVPAGNVRSDDRVLPMEGFRVVAGPGSRRALAGTVVDFVRAEDGEGGVTEGFCVLDDLEARVRGVLEDEVNPTVAAHGGCVELESVEDGVARVRMEGGCQGCRAARLTLRGVVERMICSRIPEVEGVEDVTDHGEGSDPFLPAVAAAAG